MRPCSCPNNPSSIWCFARNRINILSYLRKYYNIILLLFDVDNRACVPCKVGRFLYPEIQLCSENSFGAPYLEYGFASASAVSTAFAGRAAVRRHQKRPTAERLLLPAVGRLSVSCIELGMLRAFQPPPNSALPVLGGLFSVPVPPDTIV